MNRMDVDGEGAIDGLFSDESDFYGCEETKEDYQDQAETFDESFWWQTEHFHLNRVAEANLNPTTDTGEAKTAATDNSSRNLELHNIYEGDEFAKQLGESSDDFVHRLPPRTTPVSSTSWLWVANPYPSKKTGRSHVQNFKDAGNKLLADFTAKRREVERQNPGKAKGTITKKMARERAALPEEIKALAREHNVTFGKWMLFVSSGKIDSVWHTIVKATAAGELGRSAKVATNDGSDRYRLICVYTEDFEDKQEVKRVLKRLVELKLLSQDNTMGIFYKCDAFTHLDIMRDNDYGLRPWIYASKDLLAEK